MKPETKLLCDREDLPELEHREKTPSSFPLKIEYLMLSWIESRAKAFTVTIEVPKKLGLKKLGKENFREKQEQTLGIYYLPTTLPFVHSFSDYLLRVFDKPNPMLGAGDI